MKREYHRRLRESEETNCRQSVNNEVFDSKRSTHMSNQEGHRAALQHRTVNAGQTNGAVDPGLVRALNERCLELMVRLAKSEGIPIPAAVSSNRALWRGLDSSARQRAANHPVLLVDIAFADAAWWRWAAYNRVAERKPSAPGFLPPRVASELMRETMTLAWIIAREDRGLATALCGMAPSVARIFCSFGPTDVDRLSTRYHRHVRLRFDEHPLYWRMYLRIFCNVSVSSVPDEDASSESRQQSLL